MEFERKGQNAALGLAAAAATVALVWFGNGLHPVWLLMWVAPLPVLLYALRSDTPAWSAGLVAWAGWFAGCGNLLGYFRALSFPLTMWALGFGLAAVVFAGGVMLCRALVQRGAVWSAVVAVPAVWATFEYARNLVWPHGSAGSLAYSQLNFLPFLQMASLTGPWGMSFVLLLFPAGLAVAWAARREAGRALRVASATVMVVAAVLAFGAVRLSTRQPGPVVKVGLIASDAGHNWIPADPGAPAERLFQEYAEQAEALFAHGAQVVVIPENLGVVTESDTAQVDAIFQPLVDRDGTMLIAGVNDQTGHVAWNEARVYASGVPARNYHKHHLLPPWENRFTPGDTRLVFDGVGAAATDRWGTEICKDMDFSNPARRNGQADVGLMLVPAWDFVVDAFWHGHIAVMRAVEDGFSLARAAKHSTLLVTDDRGRVIAERASDAAPFATLLATVPAGHNGTLYLLWGDWFAWCAMALVVWVLVRRWFVPGLTTENTESAEEAVAFGIR